MKYLRRFENFLFEFKETDKNTPVLYKDDNLEVKVVKTPDASREQGKNTNWCSNSKSGFYMHNMTSNMYRFNFKDGYKLRLTWDYITKNASHLGSYSGGTHWGQGGVVNGEKQWYDVFRPEIEDDPFLIDWKKPEKREIVERILSIPKSAQEKVKDYQEKHTKEKSETISYGYNEVAKIKIKNIGDYKLSDRWLFIPIIIEYLDNKYEIKLSYEGKKSTFFELGNFTDKFKNKYMYSTMVFDKYLFDKLMEFLKSNNRKDVLDSMKIVDDIVRDRKERITTHNDIWSHIEEVISDSDLDILRGYGKVNVEKILKKYKDKFTKYDMSDIIELAKASRGE